MYKYLKPTAININPFFTYILIIIRWAFTDVKFVATCPAAAFADAKLELAESTARLLDIVKKVSEASLKS